MQAREWNVAPLNAFRKFLFQAPHKTFEDINPDPVVVKHLKELYATPDDVELYPGLFSEQNTTRMDPAIGICMLYLLLRFYL